MKSAVATGCDGDVELITGSFQVDRLILRLHVVVVFYFLFFITYQMGSSSAVMNMMQFGFL